MKAYPTAIHRCLLVKHESKIILLLFSFLLLLSFFSFSQQLEGIPFIRNYSATEYGAATDNWAIAQDARGVMYFGNAKGVLVYDGIKWRLIPVSNTSIVRSIAIDNNGLVYIGAVGEFGFLAPDENGVLVYHSLMNKLPEQEKDFADVWKTYVTPDGIYFQTFTKLMLLSKDSIKFWKPQTAFHFSFCINDELFINEREKGLKHVVSGNIIPVKGGEVFANMRIYGMLPYQRNKILIATREKGLFIMNKKARGTDSIVKKFSVEVDNYLINDQVYGAVALRNNRYAFATLKNGVFITDQNGDIVQAMNKQNGLQDDIIKYVFTDYQQDLWIALGNGISRAEISSPLTFIDDAHGLKGSIEDILKVKKSLYVATSLGVFVVESDNRKNKNEIEEKYIFSPIHGILSQTWSLLKFIFKKDTILLASSEAGIYKIEGSGSTNILGDFGYILMQSKKNPERVFIGMNDGLSSMRFENRQWRDEGHVKGITEEIRSIAEDKNGDLWLGTHFEGLIKVDFLNNEKSLSDSLITSWGEKYELHEYDTASGLPENKDVIPNNFKGRIIFGTGKGIYEFEGKSQRFLPSRLFGNQLQGKQIYRFVPKADSTIWIYSAYHDGNETGIAQLKNDNTYSWYSTPFRKVSEREIFAIYPDENEITWLGGADGLLRYDARVKKDYAQTFYALISKVSIAKDSLIFGGSFYHKNADGSIPAVSQSALLKPTVKYLYNSLMFEFSATSFGDEKNSLFCIYLEGFDKEWSGWSTKSMKEYTNLKEGNYIFHVRAKNIYGAESIESKYEFNILPPWYRTVWAYLGYVIFMVCFVYILIKLSIRRLVKAKMRLERIVAERTAEVVKQKEEIENQKNLVVQQKQEVEGQKHLVEEHQKEIISSITYAKRLQRAILPSNEEIKKYLPDCFILYKPKDIVAGDFYWLHTVNGNEIKEGNLKEGIPKFSNSKITFIAAADSTGHGVPGAMVSVVCSNALNRAVNEFKLIETGKILDKTRDLVLETFEKSGEEIKDGMDISLLSFRYDAQSSKLLEINWSGANNPLWYTAPLPDGEGPGVGLREIKADKQAIGKTDYPKPFTTHTVDFSTRPNENGLGLTLYLFTDGFADQFGGPKGKKYKYKPLQENLILTNNLPLEEQKEKLEQSFDDWKGDLEQIDDVTIIGIRL